MRRTGVPRRVLHRAGGQTTTRGSLKTKTLAVESCDGCVCVPLCRGLVRAQSSQVAFFPVKWLGDFQHGHTSTDCRRQCKQNAKSGCLHSALAPNDGLSVRARVCVCAMHMLNLSLATTSIIPNTYRIRLASNLINYIGRTR